MRGYGLYALALAAAVPSLVSAVVDDRRGSRIVAPDLVRGWPRPSAAAIGRLFREGFGAWLGAWGWRLSIATDAIVLASLGHPLWITMLAMTAKLGQMMTQMSWVPGDSSLVGLAQLSGEQQPRTPPRCGRRCVSRLSRARDRRRLHPARGQRRVRQRVGRSAPVRRQRA